MVWTSFDLSRDAETSTHGQSIPVEVLRDQGKSPTKAPNMLEARGHEQRAEKLRQDYSFPDEISIEIPADPMEVEDTTSMVRTSNLVYWSEAHFSVGLCFPLPALILLLGVAALI